MTLILFSGLLIFSLLAVSPVLAAPTSSASTTPGAGPTVTIASGVIVGKTTTVSNQPSVTANARAYLGVPFAQSPPERFSPPVAAAPWSSPLQAQGLKPACIQQFSGSGRSRDLTIQFSNNPGGPAPEESEDCLYLNVYTPSNVTPASKKPVMFWIYGGNLQFGTASQSYYDGTSLAVTQDVVVVTINYRTNIFGFSNSPDVPVGSQNSGFLDQRFALQWVQKNIAQFGGDPTKVMIFGESAGGESVKQLLANPPTPLPFSSAILESQNAVIPGNGLANYRNVAAHFGCSTIQCMRNVSATDIKSYIEVNSLGFPPVQGDGTSVRDIRGSITTRKFAKVPVMLGTNLNEARLFLAIAGLNNGTALVNGALAEIGVTSQAGQQNIVSQYAAGIVNDAYLLADRIGTDAVFTCTTSTIASYLTLNGYTVWRYRYNPSFPTTSLFANSGAFHSAEIPEVFGTYPLSNQFGTVTQQQIQLSAFMQKTWATMARTGSVSWPKIGSNFGLELGELGLGSSNGVTVGKTISADYPCLAYLALEDALGLSY